MCHVFRFRQVSHKTTPFRSLMTSRVFSKRCAKVVLRTRAMKSPRLSPSCDREPKSVLRRVDVVRSNPGHYPDRVRNLASGAGICAPRVEHRFFPGEGHDSDAIKVDSPPPRVLQSVQSPLSRRPVRPWRLHFWFVHLHVDGGASDSVRGEVCFLNPRKCDSDLGPTPPWRAPQLC